MCSDAHIGFSPRLGAQWKALFGARALLTLVVGRMRGFILARQLARSLAGGLFSGAALALMNAQVRFDIEIAATGVAAELPSAAGDGLVAAEGAGYGSGGGARRELRPRGGQLFYGRVATLLIRSLATFEVLRRGLGGFVQDGFSGVARADIGIRHFGRLFAHTPWTTITPVTCRLVRNRYVAVGR